MGGLFCMCRLAKSRSSGANSPPLARPAGSTYQYLSLQPKGYSVQHGAFVLSLDFELIWGVRDKLTIAEYGANIRGVREAVPALLDLFAERGIACTWATVGLLFFDSKEAMRAALPARMPHYADALLSPYPDIPEVGADEATDPYHYGLSLIRRICDYPAQEIGTHTFSHFYCLEEGGDVDALRADLEAARAAASRLGIELKSIAFPRNQYSPAHLALCRELGLRAFRGNERIWFHRARRDGEQTLAVRGTRLVDSYLPIGGAHVHDPTIVEGMVDVPSSRFLRPVRSDALSEAIRLRRITTAMETAARERKLFHLWWHPHNFGVDLDLNLAFLTAILDHFRLLQDRYGMRAQTMAAIANESLNGQRPVGTAHG